MRRICLYLCVLLAGALLIASCTPDPGQRAVLTGRVTAEDTTVYLSGVRVYETSHDKLSTVSDSLGYFKLDGVQFEEHNIYFEKDGFEKTVLNFEYSGKLARPYVTRHVTMKATGAGQ